MQAIATFAEAAGLGAGAEAARPVSMAEAPLAASAKAAESGNMANGPLDAPCTDVGAEAAGLDAGAEAAGPCSMAEASIAAPCAASAETAGLGEGGKVAGGGSMADGSLDAPCTDVGAEVTALDAAGCWLLVGTRTGRLQLYSDPSPSWRAPAELVADTDLAEGAATGPVEQVSVQPASGIALALRAGTVTIHQLGDLSCSAKLGEEASAFALNSSHAVLRLAVATPSCILLFRLGAVVEQLRSLPLAHGRVRKLLWHGKSLACGFRHKLLLLCDESGRFEPHSFVPDGGETCVMWEHERWIPGRGWGGTSFGAAPIPPMGSLWKRRSATAAAEDGGERVASLSLLAPPPSTAWSEPWRLERAKADGEAGQTPSTPRTPRAAGGAEVGATDEGWEFALDWGQRYVIRVNMHHCVRRRRWVRIHEPDCSPPLPDFGQLFPNSTGAAAAAPGDGTGGGQALAVPLQLLVVSGAEHPANAHSLLAVGPRQLLVVSGAERGGHGFLLDTSSDSTNGRRCVKWQPAVAASQDGRVLAAAGRGLFVLLVCKGGLQLYDWPAHAPANQGDAEEESEKGAELQLVDSWLPPTLETVLAAGSGVLVAVSACGLHGFVAAGSCVAHVSLRSRSQRKADCASLRAAAKRCAAVQGGGRETGVGGLGSTAALLFGRGSAHVLARRLHEWLNGWERAHAPAGLSAAAVGELRTIRALCMSAVEGLVADSGGSMNEIVSLQRALEEETHLRLGGITAALFGADLKVEDSAVAEACYQLAYARVPASEFGVPDHLCPITWAGTEQVEELLGGYDAAVGLLRRLAESLSPTAKLELAAAALRALAGLSQTPLASDELLCMWAFALSRAGPAALVSTVALLEKVGWTEAVDPKQWDEEYAPLLATLGAATQLVLELAAGRCVEGREAEEREAEEREAEEREANKVLAAVPRLPLCDCPFAVNTLLRFDGLGRALAPGDHVRLGRGLLSAGRHGIYVAQGAGREVVWFAPAEQKASSDNSISTKSVTLSRLLLVLRLTSLDAFVSHVTDGEGRPLDVELAGVHTVRYAPLCEKLDGDLLAPPAALVVWRALSRLGERGVDLRGRKGERFAASCHRGYRDNGEDVPCLGRPRHRLPDAAADSGNAAAAAVASATGIISAAGATAGLAGRGLLIPRTAIIAGGATRGLVVGAAVGAGLAGFAASVGGALLVGMALPDNASLQSAERTRRARARLGSRVGGTTASLGATAVMIAVNGGGVAVAAVVGVAIATAVPLVGALAAGGVLYVGYRSYDKARLQSRAALFRRVAARAAEAMVAADGVARALSVLCEKVFACPRAPLAAAPRENAAAAVRALLGVPFNVVEIAEREARARKRLAGALVVAEEVLRWAPYTPQLGTHPQWGFGSYAHFRSDARELLGALAAGRSLDEENEEDWGSEAASEVVHVAKLLIAALDKYLQWAPTTFKHGSGSSSPSPTESLSGGDAHSSSLLRAFSEYGGALAVVNAAGEPEGSLARGLLLMHFRQLRTRPQGPGVVGEEERPDSERCRVRTEALACVCGLHDGLHAVSGAGAQEERRNDAVSKLQVATSAIQLQYATNGGAAECNSAIAVLVRGQLYTALFYVMLHGFKDFKPIGGRCHIWDLVQSAADAVHELHKTNGNPLYTPAEISLTKAVVQVNEYEGMAANSNIKFRSFVYQGFNDRLLHEWITLLTRDEPTMQKFYETWACMRDLSTLRILMSTIEPLGSLPFLLSEACPSYPREG
ncbi:hypothetical protein T492DRAFT_986172 [Pavlovales sp. CCMP2436]|nr:hypothetical protein T492DRAFT_986172 [Pavlovales sp. CCMP2436]